MYIFSCYSKWLICGLQIQTSQLTLSSSCQSSNHIQMVTNNVVGMGVHLYLEWQPYFFSILDGIVWDSWLIQLSWILIQWHLTSINQIRREDPPHPHPPKLRLLIPVDGEPMVTQYYIAPELRPTWPKQSVVFISLVSLYVLGSDIQCMGDLFRIAYLCLAKC